MSSLRLNRVLAFVPLLERLRRYRWSDLRHDARAGLNVALLDFPQSMAYAMIAGLPVQAGLYGSALGSVSAPWFASSRFLIAGPSNATAVLLLSGMATLNIPEGQRLAVLPVLVMMVATVFLLGAALNAGVIVRYISRTVITGYVTAAGCLIVANQIKNVLGLHIARDSTLFSTVWHTLQALPETNPVALATGASTLVLYFLLRRFLPGLPHVAITLTVVTAATTALTHFAGLSFETLSAAGVGDFSLALPQVDLELCSKLASPAIAIAFLAFLESTSIAKTLAARAGDTIDVRQHMISLGIANAVSALGRGMPVSGSPARSTLNWSSGAHTPLANFISGLLVIAGIITLSPLIALIPKAGLGALVIAVGLALIDPRTIAQVVRTTRSDAATFAATAIGGILFPLDTAIFLGVLTSLLLFLHKVAQPKLVEYAFNQRGELAEKTSEQARTVPAVSIVHVEGDLFFGAADVFLEQMRLLVQTENLKVILLRMRNAHNLDATAAFAIAELVKFARQNGRDVVVSGLQPDAEAVFRRSGLLDLIGEQNIFRYTPENVTLCTRDALKRAQQIIGAEKADIILFAKPTIPED